MSATKIFPPYFELSGVAEHRNMMYLASLEKLQHFAYRALSVFGKKNDDVIVLCVQVDSRWRPLVDVLCPKADWDSIRDTGAEPVSIGTATWGVCRLIADTFPDLEEEVLSIPPKGLMRAIVLNHGGCTLYEITPKEMTSAV